MENRNFNGNLNTQATTCTISNHIIVHECIEKNVHATCEGKRFVEKERERENSSNRTIEVYAIIYVK